MTPNRHSELDHVEQALPTTITAAPDYMGIHAPARDVPDDRTYQIQKRGLDIFVSVAALLFFAPLFVVIAIAIKLSSNGPVLFRQERLGRQFKPFVFYKFRSMYADSDQSVHKAYVSRLIAGRPETGNGTGNGTAAGEKKRIFKITGDARVTPFGRLLRRTSLDELPQLWNVLRGEMSLVGPRPCIRYELEQYADWHTLRLIDVKPGMTGLWQVAARNRVGFDEMVKLDLAYVKQRSVWLDIKILLRTPQAIISGRGAC
jgi:lipopolysaccharide/colanic/teichoic acid biosynthesis glycosyltransferase